MDLKSSVCVGFVCVAALVSGCSDPQEMCIYPAKRDYAAAQAAVVEAQENIARGYAVHKSAVPYTKADTCYRQSSSNPGLIENYDCSETRTYTQETPVAIDVNRERGRLAALQQKLVQLDRTFPQQVAACKAQYPG